MRTAALAKIGKTFINERTKRNLSIEDVQNKIHISKSYLIGIESGDYAVFPARIFAKSYFDQYAKFLNLNITFTDSYYGLKKNNKRTHQELSHSTKDQLQNADQHASKLSKVMTACFVIVTLIILSIMIYFYLIKEPVNKSYSAPLEIPNDTNQAQIFIFNQTYSYHE
tara:strand:+ start:65 stop:568 length:504 start_codon:yes stop_codon:yes gene_type:complete